MDYSKVKELPILYLKVVNYNILRLQTSWRINRKTYPMIFQEISPSLYAKINLKGALMVDARLTSIQLTLCTKLDTGEQIFSPVCSMKST